MSERDEINKRHDEWQALNDLTYKKFLEGMTERSATDGRLFKLPQDSSGWSCPRCSRIYGPSVQICTVCNTKVASKENA